MKKIVFFSLLFVIFPIILYAQNLYKAVYDGDIVYIKKYIEEFNKYIFWGDWIEVSNSDFRLLRNTIYAMHGYKFKSKDLQEHFQKFAWYKGTKENVDNELNEKEKMLIRIILATEAANPPTRKDLVGEWIYPVAASVESIGFIHYYIKSDGRIERSANYDAERGHWYLEGTTFRTIPDPPGPDDWMHLQHYDNPLDWTKEVKNLRISFVEYNGKLYKACNFFNQKMYEVAIPSKYWEGWD